MTKQKSKLRADKVYTNITQLTCASGEDVVLDLSTLAGQPIRAAQDTSKTLRMKKFRFQLLHRFLADTFEPCRAADVGGGKGLLSHLLIQDGWQAVVIDPFDQALPGKFKDTATGQRVKIHPDDAIPRISAPFEVEHAAGFDLLIGLHAHGSNAKIIDAAARYGCGFVLFPCCVIDEPFYPRLGVHWVECLAGYALHRGLAISPFRLNFKGQNIGLCYPGKCRMK
jgi:hypothetical protein